MIDFACKKFNIIEIVRCSLGLTKTEYTIFLFLTKNNTYISSRTLARDLKLDLTTAQRAMKKLHEQKIVSRTQENLENGGYIFRYKIKNNFEIRIIIMNIIKNWTKSVESELKIWK